MPEGLELLEGVHGAERVEELAVEAANEDATTTSTNSTTTDEDDHADDHHYDEADSHNSAAWKFGASLLGGFLIPILLGAIFPPPDLSECEVCRERAAADANAASNLSAAARDKVIKDGDDVTKRKKTPRRKNCSPPPWTSTATMGTARTATNTRMMLWWSKSLRMWKKTKR